MTLGLLRSLKRKTLFLFAWVKEKKWQSWEKSLEELSAGVTKVKRSQKIIVSLTSYEPRLLSLGPTLRSLLKQTMKPDLIVVWLSCDFSLLPLEVWELRKYGIEFRHAPFDAKSHKKYLFSLREYPNDYLITVDDDIVFDKYLISSLWKTHQKYPDCIIARRVHEVRFGADGSVLPYLQWGIEWKKTLAPSYLLCATSGAGALFPPNSLHILTGDFGIIASVALSADDLWLKYMSLLQGTKTVWAKNRYLPLHTTPSSQTVSLTSNNVFGGQNDATIRLLEHYFRDRIVQKIGNRFYPLTNDRS